MKFSFEHMSFKDGRNRIQFVHLKKPVKYGLAGMAQSKLFDRNLPFVVRDDCILRRSTAAGAVPAVAKRRQRSVVSIGCLRLNHHSVVLGRALQNCVGGDLIVHNHGGPTARIAL